LRSSLTTITATTASVFLAWMLGPGPSLSYRNHSILVSADKFASHPRCDSLGRRCLRNEGDAEDCCSKFSCAGSSFRSLRDAAIFLLYLTPQNSTSIRNPPLALTADADTSTVAKQPCGRIECAIATNRVFHDTSSALASVIALLRASQSLDPSIFGRHVSRAP